MDQMLDGFLQAVGNAFRPFRFQSKQCESICPSRNCQLALAPPSTTSFRFALWSPKHREMKQEDFKTGLQLLDCRAVGLYSLTQTWIAPEPSTAISPKTQGREGGTERVSR